MKQAAIVIRRLEERIALLEQADQARNEPIAIVGMGCRLPGGASSPEAFWELLEAGRDAVQPLDGRWALVGAQPGEDVPRWAGVLTEDVDAFDAAFFGIAPREARSLDPQHRLLLEVAWEALERAGIPPRTIEGSRTGVFVGAWSADYGQAVAQQSPDEQDAYCTTGNMLSIAAGRLSYTLGLQGACLTVDTACSSSLVAIHLACRSLHTRESDLVIAGGVNMLLSPGTMAAVAHTQALSPDGRCRAFDASANGFVRGEGCGMIVLKRLSDAQRDGDRIWALIRGSAVNQDGRSTGLTAPNVRAQQTLLRDALQSARVEPGAIGYIETHGTGTALGDPIEVEALREVIGAPRSDGSRCVLGALKTNIGHLEGAAGVAGLIKAVLALQHERIPKNLNFRTLNPRIRLEKTALTLATEPISWPRTDRPRLAGVSSFGMSGTNAHVVLEEAPASPVVPTAPQRAAEMFILSAKSAAGLDVQAARLRDHLDAHPEIALGDMAFSLATTRSSLEHRLSVIATSRDEARAALSAAAQGQTPAGAVRGAVSLPRGKLAFLFTGQGAQVPGMGRGLYKAWPAFHEALNRSVSLFDRETSRPLREIMAAFPDSAEAALLDQTEFTQPALFAMEYALAVLWRSWGVEPDMVAGHSIGEIVAACIAGVFSLEEAVRLVAARGRLMQALPAGGAMVSIAASEPEVAAALSPHSMRVSIAGVNGPDQVVIAGAADRVQLIAESFASRGVRTKALRVSHAFHSPLMDPMLEAFRRVALTVKYKRPSIPLVSNVSGKLCGDEVMTPDYWVRHVREAVRFADGVRSLHAAGVSTFVEVGPKATLLGLVPGCLPDAQPVLVPTLSAGREEAVGALSALGTIWAAGASVNWSGVFPAGGRRVPLPTYPWQRERHWIGARPKEPRAVEDRIKDWFYRVDWPEAPRTGESSRQGSPGSWLVLADRGGFGDTVAASLSSRGVNCVLLPVFDVEQARDVLGSRSDWAGVVYLAGLDAVVDESTEAGEVSEATLHALVPVLALLRAQSAASISPRLWIVTRGACAVGGEPALSPCQAALWGLGRVLALEHPAAWGGLVDLDPEAKPGEVDTLVTEILSPDTEDQLALRGGRRHAARLVSAPPESPAVPVSLSPEGAYLVTGGLGALGLLVARWLVERGARRLVLTSRHGLPDRSAWAAEQPPEVRARIEAVEALEAQGARVTAAAVDVADAEQMSALLSTLEPPLRGVVHAAGLLDDGLLAHLDAGRIANVLRPKVQGAWTLHTLTRGLPIDFFILFSSVAGVLGSIGQSSYAAGNAFLDTLASQRRRRGLPAVSIDWGLWAEGLMATEAQRRDLESSGVRAMETTSALSAMDRLLGAGAAPHVVARMDWARVTRSGHLLDRLIAAREATPEPKKSAPFRQGRSAAETRAGLLALVRGIVAHVLGFLDATALDADRGFAELGVDSLMAVQIRNRLRSELDVALPATVAFDHPTVERLTAHLITDVLRLEDRADAPAAGRADTTDEPIAIVGAACRFPGGVGDLESYWRSLTDRVVAASEVPAGRWDMASFYDPNPGTPGRSYANRAGFLRDVEAFDPGFFRISPREAQSLDPQQRLLLEVSWEALEHAGQDPTRLKDSPTGVFVGAGPNEYAERFSGLTDEAAAMYSGTGNMFSVLAGRLSFFLGLHGPTLAVDTACSSSLVALHLACQSLHDGECNQALVGGVNVLLAPANFVMLSRMRALAPDGTCKTFSSAADGYGRAEGCGVVVLKRLSDAQRDGDRVLALIRGTAINHDGPSSGLTVPNGPAQQAVLRQALSRAGVAPAEVDFVECHGTGTALGDPIEVGALGAVYGSDRPADRPLVLGAVKANLGHLEPAAGMAGLLKVVLGLGHEQIPAQPAFDTLNPHIPWDELPVTVARDARPWPRGARPRRAGLSAFGMSGTNAHVVIEEAPPAQEPPPAPERAAEIVALSAKSGAALAAQARRLAAHLRAHPELGTGDVAYSLALTRGAMDHRLAVTATTREALLSSLEAAAEEQVPSGVVGGAASPSRGKLAFLFTGQGAQVLGMGRALHGAWPSFRGAFDACAESFDRALDRPLRDVMWAAPGSADAELLDQTGYTQPALFTLEYALAALWRSWGVTPDLVAGHSVGEIVAACVAGVFSLEDAVRLVAARGRLMQALPAGGAMVSIAAPEAEVAEALSSHAARVSIAGINGPGQVVIAGAADAVQALAESFASRGFRTKALRVSHAFHSPLMDPMLEAFGRVAEAVKYHEPSIPLVSNLSGKLSTDEITQPSYWVRHVREAVRFADGVRSLHEAGARAFVEVGPKSTLLGLVPACVEQADVKLVPSLRAGSDEAASALDGLGKWWVGGGHVDWAGVFPAGGRRVPLPAYPWQRQRYWLDAANASLTRAGAPSGHPLLGVRVPAAGSGAVFESVLSLSSNPWLGDHRVAGQVLVPGAALVELVRAAGAHVVEGGSARVTDLVLREPLVIPDGGARRVQVVLGEASGAATSATVYSQPADGGVDAGWTLHVTATVDSEAGSAPPGALDLAAIRERCVEALDIDHVYARFDDAGLAYGPAFRGMRSLRRGKGESLAEIALPEGNHAEGYGVSPALLDAAFQAAVGVFDAGAAQEMMLPFMIGGFTVQWPSAAAAWVHVRLREGGSSDGVGVDVTLVDAGGARLAEVTELRVRRASRDALQRGGAAAEAFYRLDWRDAPLSDASPGLAGGTWLIVAPAGSHRAAALAARLGPSVVTDTSGFRAALVGTPALAGVVCVWELEAMETAPAAAIRVATEGLVVAQALQGRGPVPLWWVTAGAVMLDEGEPAVAGLAPVWGLGRTVMVEQPDLRCKLVDLEPGADGVDVLLRELAAGDSEDQVALRGGRRRVARLVHERSSAVEPSAPPCRRGTVLVTGGLGALGSRVARWLAEQGVSHLLLTGRRGMDSPGAAEEVAALKDIGAQVTVCAADIADERALRAVIEAIPADLPLRGVVHAAGTLDDGVISDLSKERIARVFAPKVAGAWNLHQLTAEMDLDFFVMFSSMAGLLGNAGQGNYAAANAFLDALAAQRRARGLPAQSLDWGPWAEGGMAATLGVAQQARLARQGVRALSSAEGIALFARALRCPATQIGAVSLDLRSVRQAYGAQIPPVWRVLVPPAPGRQTKEEDQGAWLARLAALPPERRMDAVRDAVQSDAARVLSLGTAAAVPIEQPLSDLGLDSLMAVELRNAVGRRVGRPLPATLAFDYPTISAIVRYLLDEVLVLPSKDRAPDDEQLDEAEIRRAMESISVADLRRAGLVDKILLLARRPEAARPEQAPKAASIDDMGADDLIRMFSVGDGGMPG